MNNHAHEHENDVFVAWGILTGLLVGGLVGAGTMLLLAPQSGKRTRAQIRQKSIQLVDQTTEAVEDGLSLAGEKTRHIRANMRKQAKRLEQRGQVIYDEQKKLFSALVENGKAAVQTSTG
jgi:gas vesicle protein